MFAGIAVSVGVVVWVVFVGFAASATERFAAGLVFNFPTLR